MKLLLGIPIRSEELKTYKLPNLELPENTEIKYFTNEESGYPLVDISHARNDALRFARENGFTDVFMLDSDLVPPRNVFALLNDCQGDIIVGSYIEKGRWRTTGFFGLMRVPVDIKTSCIACGLIRQKPLYDLRLDFTIRDPQFSDDGNFRKLADKLGYKTTICSAFCEHIYNHARFDFNQEDRRTFDAIRASLSLLYSEIGFWLTQKMIQKGDLLNLPLEHDFLKAYLKHEGKRVFALQTERSEYAVLSGFEESENKNVVDVSVITPTVPTEFSELELSRLIVTINMIHDY